MLAPIDAACRRHPGLETCGRCWMHAQLLLTLSSRRQLKQAQQVSLVRSRIPSNCLGGLT